MLKRFILFVFLLISFTCSDRYDTTDLTLHTYEYREDEFDLQVINDVNTYRVQQGLNTLVTSNHISYICSTHNDYMILSHTLDHSYFYDRATNIQRVLHATRIGEVIAYNYQTSSSVVTAWTNSQSHRRILESDFTHIGVSVSEDSLDRKHVTLILAKI
jgi:uncharacterized protein YkwD